MRRRKKIQRVWQWIAAIAALAVALTLLLLNVVFVVRNVQIVGAGDLSDAEVLRLSGIRLGARIDKVNAQRVQLDVESDGRLAFVSLERRLPSSLVLTVRPRSMDALVLQAGKVIVLDSDAYVVQISDRLPEGTVLYVTGIRANYYMLGRQLDTADGRCAAMKAVVEALKAQNVAARVSELSVADIEDLRIFTHTGLTVLLGDSGNMNAKIAWMAGALADLEARGESGGLLDVSSATKADYRPPEPSEDIDPADGVVAEGEAQEVQTEI